MIRRTARSLALSRTCQAFGRVRFTARRSRSKRGWSVQYFWTVEYIEQIAPEAREDALPRPAPIARYVRGLLFLVGLAVLGLIVLCDSRLIDFSRNVF